MVIDNPDVLVKDIEILTPGEKQQMLIDFNNTGTEYFKGKTIHQLFEEQVERTPESIAVVFEYKHLKYRELSECPIGRIKSIIDDAGINVVVSPLKVVLSLFSFGKYFRS